MHAIELVDLAAVLSIHGPSLLFRRELIPEVAIQSYWAACRGRFDYWHGYLGECRHLLESHKYDQVREWWNKHECVVEEVLLSELLTRTYAALGASLDHGHQAQEIAPITHSVFLTHLEARGRALRLILDSRVVSLEAAVRVNRLRAKLERWNDSLLAHLFSDTPEPAERYAFETRRMKSSMQEIQGIPAGATRDTAGWILWTAIRNSLAEQSQRRSLLEFQNRRVGDAVLMCLRPDLFDAVGLCKTLWLHRLERGAEQTDRVLQQLAKADIGGETMLGAYETVRDPHFGRW